MAMAAKAMALARTVGTIPAPMEGDRDTVGGSPTRTLEADHTPGPDAAAVEENSRSRSNRIGICAHTTFGIDEQQRI